MKIENFITEATGYYGQYSPTAKKYAIQWLQNKNLSERKMLLLWAEIMKIHSSVYKIPPDVEALEKAWKNVIARPDQRPELQEYNNFLQLEEYVDRDAAQKFITELIKTIKSGKNPRENEALLKIAGMSISLDTDTEN